MTFHPTPLGGVLLVEPQVFGDARGFFFESFNRRELEAAAGRAVDFNGVPLDLSAQRLSAAVWAVAGL